MDNMQCLHSCCHSDVSSTCVTVYICCDLYVFPVPSTGHNTRLLSPASRYLCTLPGLIYGPLFLFMSNIVEYCTLWLPLQTLCHFVPRNVTTEPPWGPYIHFNWFGKDLAAFELKRVWEETGEWGREMEKKKSKTNWRSGESVCVDGRGLLWQPSHFSFRTKNTKKRAVITLTY